MKLKIMTYNIQHCNDYLRGIVDPQVIANAILREDADIVGLNEVWGDGAGEISQAETLAELAGYPYFYFAKAIEIKGGRGYGNALLSRHPIILAETVRIPDPTERRYGGYYESRVILKAVIDVKAPITVCVTHFGLNPDEAENAVSTATKTMPKEHALLMGDFNLPPESPLLEPIRTAFRDASEPFCANAPTFPSTEPRVKIDYIFTTRDLKVLAASVPDTVASDHRAHTAQIEI